MKRIVTLVIVLAIACTTFILFSFTVGGTSNETLKSFTIPFLISQNVSSVESSEEQLEVKSCTFRTIFGEESSDSHFIYKTPENVDISIQNGLKWIVEAQHNDGGWGAGSHSMQRELNPHKVNPTLQLPPWLPWH